MGAIRLRTEVSYVLRGVAVVVAAVGLASCSTGVSTPPEETITYSAAYVSYDSPESLTADAALIVEVRVFRSEVREIPLESHPDGTGPRSNPALGATSETVAMPPLIYTVATITIQRVIRGDAEVGAALEVKQLGGTLDGRSAVLPGAATLATGSTYVLYLGPGGEGPSSLLNQDQAAYIEVAPGAFAPAVQGDAVAREVATLLSSDR